MASTVKAGMTTSSLLKSVKRRAMVPDNQNTFSDQDFIDLMNEEMMISMVPSIMQVKEEYFIFRQVVPLVAEKSNYAVPERAPLVVLVTLTDILLNVDASIPCSLNLPSQ